LDIADGVVDGVANEPWLDLVQFVTMQELSAIYDWDASPQIRKHKFDIRREMCYFFVVTGIYRYQPYG
jgi:hypothetical protein